MNYQISLDYDDYFKCSNMIKAEKIEVVGDSIWFYTDEMSITYLQENNITYMLQNNKRGQAKQKSLKYSGVIIGLLLVVFAVILNFYRVSEIVYSGNYPINDEIKTMIEKENKQLLFFTFHPNNYADLSKKVRVAFKEYEWISITKDGSKILVSIEATKSNEHLKDSIDSGFIVAKKDGVVSQFIAFDGKVMVEDNLYVKKGDVLIDGSISGAKGYVLATTYEEVQITVSKKIATTQKTGNKINYYELNLFNKAFYPFKKTSFNDYEITKINKFSIPYLLGVNKIEEFEKCDIIYTYTEQEAIEYAKSLVEASFNAAKILPQEQIVMQKLLTVKETEDAFAIKLMVKKIESIGEFKEYA